MKPHGSPIAPIVAAAAQMWCVCPHTPASTETHTPPAHSTPTVTVERHAFVGDHREASMWSALYAARSGKLYIGLCTHAEAAHLYEFDPASRTMSHLADLTVFQRERGLGIRTTGKIHVRMGEDDSGNVYFGGLCEDTGPEPIDPSSYRGPHWYRYNPSRRVLEDLGLINRHWGLLGMIMDQRNQCLFGLAEDGHLYKYDVRAATTLDLGRVDDWDICRTIFANDRGDVFGSFPVARVWKYEAASGRVIDLPYLRLENDLRAFPRTMSNPMIDRKVLWRVIEWNPADHAAYGIMGATSLLFRFDPHDGAEGTIQPLTRLCAPQYLERDVRQTPYATLALAIDRRQQTIYYAPVMHGSFDYMGVSWDVHDEEKFAAKLAGEQRAPLSWLVAYDIPKARRRDLGAMRTNDGRAVYGLGGACWEQATGAIDFVGAVEEPDPAKVVSKVQRTYPFSMALLRFQPASPPAPTRP